MRNALTVDFTSSNNRAFLCNEEFARYETWTRLGSYCHFSSSHDWIISPSPISLSLSLSLSLSTSCLRFTLLGSIAPSRGIHPLRKVSYIFLVVMHEIQPRSLHAPATAALFALWPTVIAIVIIVVLSFTIELRSCTPANVPRCSGKN